ncbi:MAG: gamma-glutamyl-gamma-aminobutyrate hydrolase family protein [Candidatus Cloacimonetes bacterium]|nr:gamma-glutamyl-gamma-aminobutyrate hydrolase family protein [Candidatus Cloacimonadota bacterium]
MEQRPLIGISTNYMKLGSYMQFHIRDKYVNALYDHGALPLLIPSIADKTLLNQYLEMVQAVIIIGGMDYPPELYGEQTHPKTEPMEMQRALSDMYLVELCLQMQKPLLGICAGMQLINIFFGGKLIQHLDNLEMHHGEKEHEIRISGGRWLKPILGWDSCIVNSNHHQGIDPQHLGKGLSPVAFSPDGGIEALEYEADSMILGIQWHPERMRDLEHRKSIFEYLCRLSDNRS